ncbi:hypothetical protein EV421DRAFT_1801620 [Armillaria borealis]|uniref:Uncharacterized protein n=1 Tax=Armillaria borealis TaxID=47425 RepID=A0AA39JLN7_9AGAR|nr:hypothetical protein EV421DRAFT_1801620 [Armillaria borealis]
MQKLKLICYSLSAQVQILLVSSGCVAYSVLTFRLSKSELGLRTKPLKRVTYDFLLTPSQGGCYRYLPPTCQIT